MKARVYFESLGRSAQAKGQHGLFQKNWPPFAKRAFLAGYLLNSSIRARGAS